MPYLEVIWTDEALEKIAEHGVRADEVEYVLQRHIVGMKSASSSRPITAGATASGRWLVVIFEWIDGITVMPITAYEPSESW